MLQVSDEEVRAMSRATTAEARRVARVSLGAMTVWVVGAAVYFALVRGARGFWLVIPTPPGRMLDLDRVFGIFLLGPALVVAAGLAAVVLRRARARRADGGTTPPALGLAWRVAGVAYLVGMAAAESRLLRLDVSPNASWSIFNGEGWAVRLVGVSLAIGLIGLLLGSVPARPRRRPARAAVGLASSAVSVAVAGVAGVLVLANGAMLLPYLVLTAIEAVSLAMKRPGMMADWVGHGAGRAAIPGPVGLGPGPSLHGRVVLAGIAAAAALIVAGLTAHWIGRDLRQPMGGPPRSRWGLAYRAVTATATLGMGIDLLFVALPGVHPALAEGFWRVLNPLGGSVIATSFLALAAGIAARGVAGPSDEGVDVEIPATPTRLRPSWPSAVALCLVRLTVAGVVALIVLAAVSHVRQEGSRPWYVPLSLTEWLEMATTPLTIKTPTAIVFDPTRAPEALIPAAGAVWLSMMTIRFLAAGDRDGRRSPIDRIGTDRRQVGRFLGAWAATAGVIFALMPAFVLGALAVFDLTLRATFP